MSQPRETPGLQLSGIVCSFCLKILGLGGVLGSSCRVSSVLFVCKFRPSQEEEGEGGEGEGEPDFTRNLTTPT